MNRIDVRRLATAAVHADVRSTTDVETRLESILEEIARPDEAHESGLQLSE